MDSQDARHARLISDASATLLELVNSVLDFSRLEAGAVDLDPAPFDPAREADAIIELLSGQAAAKGLTIELVAEPGGFLSGDAQRLRQVLLNFLSNAIKFTAKGAVHHDADAAAGRRSAKPGCAKRGGGHRPAFPKANSPRRLLERFTQCRRLGLGGALAAPASAWPSASVSWG